MRSRVEPARESSLLATEMRRLVQLRWAAGSAILAGALVSRFLWSEQTAWTSGAVPRALAMGVAILAYNALFAVLLRRPVGTTQEPSRSPSSRLVAIAWAQITLDLGCLTLATLGTGGMSGPVAGFFVLHMVLSSMLLSSIQAYAAAGLAVGMVLAGLAIGGQWPADGEGFVRLAGWSAVLLLTSFLTGRITADLRSRQAAMRVQHEQIRAILDTAIEGIITINAQGVMLSANPAAERIFGYDSGELVGRRVNELMPEPDRSRHDGYIEQYRTTRKPKIIGTGREVVGLRKDGSRVPLDLSVSEVKLTDRTLYTGILRDISDRKRAEEELLTVNQALQRHQQALIQTEKMVAMGQMAAGIVHEIGNPLASMDTLLQLVERQPARLSGAAGSDTVAVLREQVGRIHRIVRQLTDFAHPNETAWEVRDVNGIVDSTLEMLRFDRRLKRVRIERRFGSDAGTARVMAHAFQQVLVNMVTNAVDAMTDVAEPILVVATGRRGSFATIEITDNGHGIAAEHLPHVFEPFFTTKPIGRGTGLGLSISYSVIQRHEGECEVESRVGSGTTFRILLPDPVADLPSAPTSTPTVGPVAGGG